MFLFHVILRYLYARYSFSHYIPRTHARIVTRRSAQASARFGMLDVRDCASFQHGVSLLVIWLDDWLTLLDNVHIH
jgi:hypothetical protein